MRSWSWLLLMAPLTLVGCGDLGDEPDDRDPGGGLVDPPTTVSYIADIQPILDSTCVGCHGVGGNAGLDLRSGVSRGNLVNVPSTESDLDLVEPGSPEQSWLYLKLTGQQTVGTEMPPGGSIGAGVDLVRTWIEEDAADN
jgi:mono/diheme cytochrome c family protein